MPAKSRTYQHSKVSAALAEQTVALRDAVREFCARPDAAELLARPTRLGEWRVRELVAHLAVQIDWVPAHLGDPLEGRPPLDLLAWVARVGTVAPLLDGQAREKAAGEFGGEPASVAGAFARAADGLVDALDGEDTRIPGRRFEIRLGSMTLTDMLVTRLVETVVHADDLADALGRADFPHARQAVAAVTRLLADAFADQAPGGAVELRIPPYAVVQAVEGPRHTRGTPPNVVETDPLTWIRLATGRTGWADAVEAAAVSAGGERSDLRGHLPVLG
ncbi:sterol carrier family protein [Streptomyces sp. BE20]|uniref:maleylpyruvate isomerase family mycothiol-dependent enzyme n=1 Tax=Streptomyces sp. BE20 TaxID=3002525 RepID=UPI002E792BB2|nr:sterol carrier family protein [Streptomyces sp. BE20]MEE1828365.1 sterol carrier family protein [Streptomyces sp. BE20]